MSGVRDRFAGLDSWRVDAIFAIAITVELQLQGWLRHGVTEQQRLVTAVASVLVAAPIAVRRARPGVALVFCRSVVAIQTLLNGEILIDSLTAPDSVVPELVLLVLCYSRRRLARFAPQPPHPDARPRPARRLRVHAR
jgi:hypothetical protein